MSEAVKDLEQSKIKRLELERYDTFSVEITIFFHSSNVYYNLCIYYSVYTDNTYYA